MDIDEISFRDSNAKSFLSNIFLIILINQLIPLASRVEVLSFLDNDFWYGRLWILENSVLRSIFGPKRDEVRGEWRRLLNKGLHAL
jgi:hypothetical protein